MKTHVNYGISRPNPNKKSRERRQHKNGKAVIEGSLNQIGFRDRLHAHIAKAHPGGWMLSGYAETGVEMSTDEYEATLALTLEFGYNGCEKRQSLDQVRVRYANIRRGT